MLKSCQKVGAFFNKIAGIVWVMLDPKGYCLESYSEKENAEMGVCFSAHHGK